MESHFFLLRLNLIVSLSFKTEELEP